MKGKSSRVLQTQNNERQGNGKQMISESKCNDIKEYVNDDGSFGFAPSIISVE